MPIVRGQDSKGTYYKVHNVHNKYYYKTGNKTSRDIAYAKSLKQLKAIKAN